MHAFVPSGLTSLLPPKVIPGTRYESMETRASSHSAARKTPPTTIGLIRSNMGTTSPPESSGQGRNVDLPRDSASQFNNTQLPEL